ncbi:MAG: F-type H+-transporting ATPase subunit delta [Candidatus Saccharimonadales bacterium]|jgi:F-type H+-transporting ATPase subunit delta
MNKLVNFTVTELEDGKSLDSVAQKVAAYLVDERKTREAPALMRAIEAEMNKRGSTQISITSATELSDAIKSQLAKALGADNPVFNTEIDPSVIGGAVARAGETELDLTVRTKLNKFKQAVAKGAN